MHSQHQTLYSRHIGGRRNYFPRFSNDLLPFTQQTTISPLGTTPDILMISEAEENLTAEKGIKIPPHDCIISWDQLKEHIADVNYIGIYDLDDDDDVFPGRGFKNHLRLQVLNETSIRREAGAWFPSFNTCGSVFGIDERVDGAKAIFRPVSGNAFIVPGKRDYIVSLNPSRYIFYFFCQSEPQDNRCRDALLILLVKDEREWPREGDGIPKGQIRLDDIPWGEIGSTLMACFGQQFIDDTDPQIKWGWTGPECAVPGSEVFEKAIMK
ncbi:uncharacterized protein LOC132725865 [Ruditapes philippinarum]|uniref:uncharacterized protein LOC132725865 n=1 Tax=Ruditapes philippinarum TaxID=129788 RepID=UPI00295ADCCA|nr:uncharacterized protein LOC132725865 [Ruditapes philippinarum]